MCFCMGINIIRDNIKTLFVNKSSFMIFIVKRIKIKNEKENYIS